MKKDINLELFKRYAPKKKLEIINSLTQEELLDITPATVRRMVKETGEPFYKSKRDKKLYVRRVIRKGNDWNSEFLGVELIKGKLYVNLYIQYENTDTEEGVEYGQFFCNGKYLGKTRRDDRCGNERCYYFTYYSDDKASAVKSLLLEYIYRKHLDKRN